MSSRSRLTPRLSLCLMTIAACDSTTAPVGGGGGGPTWSISTVATAPGPTRLVVDAGFLYWVDSSGTPFNRIDVSSGLRTPVLQSVPSPSSAFSDGSYVYWVSGPRLYRTTLDGLTTTILDQGTSDPSVGVTTTIAWDATSIYWANAVPSNTCSPACTFTIRKLPKAGGAATTLVTTSQAIVDFALTNGSIYWEEVGIGPASADGKNGSQIKSTPATGGSVTVIVDGLENGLIPPPDSEFVPASWHPGGGIVVDDSAVYFGDASYYTSYRVLRAPVGGGSVTILRADTTGDPSDFPRAFVLDAGMLYWLDENSLQTLPVQGGAPVTLAQSLTSPTALLRVGSELYWLEAPCCAHGDRGTIKTMPVTGGTPVSVASGFPSAMWITSDGTSLYVLGGGPIGAIEGFADITRVSLDGSSRTTLVEAAGAGPFSVVGGYLYFANSFTIKRVPAVGGIAQIVAIGDFYVADVASDGLSVYWTEDPLCAVRKAPVAPGDTGSVTTLAIGSGMGPAGKLLVQGGQVYFLDHEDRIERVSTSGGSAVTVVGPKSGFLTDFTLAAGDIYYSGWDQPGIWAVPLDGGDTSLVNPIGGLPDQTRRLAVDASGVYAIDQRGVWRYSFVGDSVFGITSYIASSPYVASGLTVRSDTVFWSEVAGSVIKRGTPK